MKLVTSRLMVVLFALLILLISTCWPPCAQAAPVLDRKAWVTNGEVKALAVSADRVYVGGRFNYIGPLTGPAAILNTATAQSAGNLEDYVEQVDACIPDGSNGWYVAGAFADDATTTYFSGVIHVLSTGDVEPNWSVVASGDYPSILTMALSPNHSILYLGGYFTNIGASDRQNVAAIDVASATVTDWNPSADGGVYVLAVSPDASRIYLAGEYSQIGGQSRSGIAAVNASDGTATEWNPGVDNLVRSIKVSGDGQTVYIGGYFANAGGQPRSRIAAIDTQSGLATGWNPNANNAVQTLAMPEGGNSIFAGGDFSNIGGQSRNHLAEISLSTGLATSWNPGADGQVKALTLSPDARIAYAAGTFSTVNNTSRRNIVALDAVAGTVDPWNPGSDGEISHLALSADGKHIAAGGYFRSAGGLTRNNLAALNVDTGEGVAEWTCDLAGQTFTNVLALAVSADNNVLYVGGSFFSLGGVSRNSLASVSTLDGSVSNWDPNVWSTWSNTYGTVRAIEPSTSGQAVYVGGSFDRVAGQSCSSLVPINETSGSPLPWTDGITGGVTTLALSPDESVLYAGGGFSQAGAQTRNNVAAFATSSGTVTSWNPNAESTVSAIQPSKDGSRIFIGGGFFSIGSSGQHYLAEVDATTGLVTPWTPSLPGEVYGLALTGDESTIIAAGWPPAYRAHSVSTGDYLYGSYDSDPYSGKVANTVAVSKDETSFYVGGLFTKLSLVNRFNLARFKFVDKLIASPRHGGVIVQGDALRFAALKQEGTYNWDFANGRSSSAQIPGLVSFSSPAELSVKLDVHLGQQKLSDSRTITVEEAPQTLGDFDVTTVTIPDDLTIGQSGNVAYTVRNAGTAAIPDGAWKDSIYFSTDPYLDVDDILLGSADRSGGLDVGETYENTIPVTLPNIAEGTYYLILSVDDEWTVLEQHQLNNEFASSINALVPALQPGVLWQGSLSSGDVEQSFRMQVDETQVLQLLVQNLPPGVEVYLRYGSPATQASYDYHLDGPEFIIPSATSGTWYVLLVGESIPQGGQYSIQYNLNSLSISSVSPGQVAFGSPVDLIITGAGFTPGTQALLVGPNDQTIAAESSTIDSYTRLSAHFTAGAVQSGTYGVRVTSGAGSTDRPSALQVIANGQAHLETDLILPSQLGRHAPATIYVEYRNTGNVPMPAPLLVVGAADPNDTNQPVLTLDSTKVSGGLWTSALPKGFDTSVQLIGNGKVAGTLQPGEVQRVPIYYVGMLQPWDFNNSNVRLGVTIVHAASTAPINWDNYKESMRPTSLPITAWDAIWANFTSSCGTTWGDYVKTLDKFSAYFSSLGHQSPDVEAIVGFMISRSDSLGLVNVLQKSVDFGINAPGFPLELVRTYSARISSRRTIGPFGRGWEHNWHYALSQDTDGTVTISAPSGGRRVFQPDLRNNLIYISKPTDAGKLARNNNGTFRLTELTGELWTFGADGKLLSVQDSNDNIVSCTYSGDNLTRVTHSSGRYLALEYNGRNQVIRVRDDTGTENTYTYGAETDYLLSANLNDRRHFTYSYYDASNPAIRDALAEVSESGTAAASFAYDSRGRITASGCDCNGSSTKYFYDDLGTILAENSASGNSRFSIDIHGKLARHESPYGNVVLNVNNSWGRPENIITTDGNTIRVTYNARGVPVRIVDSLENETVLEYSSSSALLTGIVDSAGRRTSFAYDNNHNLANTNRSDGARASWEYGNNGLLKRFVNARNQETQFQFNNDGNVTEILLPDQLKYTYIYDTEGKLTTANGPGGATSLEYSNDGFLTRVTYPGSRWIGYEYDDRGRRVKIEDQSGHGQTFTYDAQGNLERTEDLSGHLLVRYEFDTANRVVHEVLGNEVQTYFAYNESNQIVSLVTYDANNKLLCESNVSYGERGHPETLSTHFGTWHYTYDGVSRLVNAEFVSAVAGVPNRLLQYEYDHLGNRVSATIDGVTSYYLTDDMSRYIVSGSANFAYDPDGNMISRAAPSGVMFFTHDSLNRMTSTSVDSESIVLQYGSLGELERVVTNGLETNFIRDFTAASRVITKYSGEGESEYYYEGAGALIASVSDDGTYHFYTADERGNIATITDESGLTESTYSYDPWGSLLQWQGVHNDWEFLGDFGAYNIFPGHTLAGARVMSSDLGRFLSEDPLGIVQTGANPYTYASNSPMAWSDTTGFQPRPIRPVRTAPKYPPRVRWTPPPRLQKPVLPSVSDPYAEAAFGFLEGLYDMIKPPAMVEQEHIFDCANRVERACQGQEGREVLFEDCEGRGRIISCPRPSEQDIHPPKPDNNSGTKGSTGIADSVDPNGKIGPSGFGPSAHISPTKLLPYCINFENDPDATAPAQVVSVRDTLSASIEWASFQLAEIGFGETMVAVPQGAQHFEMTVPYSLNSADFEVHIEAGIRLATGEVYANFYTVDPETGLPPAVGIGFLPPEDGTGRGQGHMSYIVKPKPGLPTGTEIRNVATIQFDFGETIATNQVNPHDPSQGTDPNKEALVTIDAGAPTGSVSALPEVSTSTDFEVSWAGSDDNGGSGIGGYDIYVRDGSGESVLWLQGTSSTSALFHGQNGHTYQFYAVAFDNAGNRQVAPSQPDTSTRVDVQAGALLVTLTPEAAAVAGARWRVDGNTWQESGATVEGLDPGPHEVTFLPVLGWKTPKALHLDVVAGTTAEANAKYKKAKLKVKVPNGGEAWPRNERNLIKWTSKGETGDKVKLELWSKGELVDVIANSSANDGKYKWKIPGTLDSGSGYKIRIESIDVPSIADLSNKTFTIVSGKITDVSKKSGEATP